MDREYHKWYSSHLNRDMELLVFGHAGARVLVFPARMGRFYEYEDWGLVYALRHFISNGWIQLFCVDSIDTECLYNPGMCAQDKIQRHLQYEKYILTEVLPFSRRKNPNPTVISHGCSLGAYHAVNIAFRHPHDFQKILALSGRYDLTVPVAEFNALLANSYTDDVYYHTPSHFIPNLTDEKLLTQLRRLEIITVNGQEDPFLENNRQLSLALWDKGIWNSFYVWEGRAHSARYWRQMVQLYM
jgi:esterase/lipase superfamily enzyme